MTRNELQAKLLQLYEKRQRSGPEGRHAEARLVMSYAIINGAHKLYPVRTTRGTRQIVLTMRTTLRHIAECISALHVISLAIVIVGELLKQ